MTRPKSVAIGPFKYTVLYTELENEEDSAFIKFSVRRIVANEDLDDQNLAESLLHEVLHGLIDLTGERPTTDEDRTASEKLIAALSPWLYQFIRSNPTFISFLQE